MQEQYSCHINFPTFQLILEGPDLVGKTTLYNKIHAMNGFKWNIQDRSTLSMLCYARLYGRDVELYRSRLDNELNNLNNRMIILLPPFEILEERYHQRGDEIQDLTSLKKLYEIFSEEAKLIHGGAGRPDGLTKGYFVKPTIFSDVKNSLEIARQEIFGPVLCIIPYDR